MIDILNRKKRIIHRNSLTTLYEQAVDVQNKRVGITRDEQIISSIRKTFKENGLVVVESSRKSQLKNLLTSPKDKKNKHEKCGIYKIACSHCNKIYIGQTKRPVLTRLQEHTKEAAKASKNTAMHVRSNVARHIFTEGHNITSGDLEVIKEVDSLRKLDVCESLEISRVNEELLMNSDSGNGYTWLFSLLR